jgi:hypothetical protein
LAGIGFISDPDLSPTHRALVCECDGGEFPISMRDSGPIKPHPQRESYDRFWREADIQQNPL